MRKRDCVYGRDGSVTGFLDGTLPPTVKSRFEEHLRFCPTCPVDVQAARSVIVFLSRPNFEPMPLVAKRRLLGDFRRSGARGRSGRLPLAIGTREATDA